MIRSRHGFTLIELMVALVIFSVGLLALVSSGSAIMNMIASSQSRTIAAGIAASRFERLRATGCTSRPLTGSATTRGISETWTVNRLVRADDVTVTIVVPADHRQKTQKFSSYIPC